VGDYGAGVFTNAGEELELAPGTFFLARPGVVHQIANTQREEMELYWVCFSLPAAGRGEIGALMKAFSAAEIVFAPAQETLTALWKALLTLARKSGTERVAGGCANWGSLLVTYSNSYSSRNGDSFVRSNGLGPVRRAVCSR
jgi:hypothetical protein